MTCKTATKNTRDKNKSDLLLIITLISIFHTICVFIAANLWRIQYCGFFFFSKSATFSNTVFTVVFLGWITDYTGSYDTTFIINGIIIMISGLMLFAIPCLYKCDPRRPMLEYYNDPEPSSPNILVVDVEDIESSI